jgi:hypothetical protein
MRTKVIALPLNEIGWEKVTAVAVEEGKCCAECGEGYPPEGGLSRLTKVSAFESLPLLKKPSNSRDSRFAFFSYADVMSPRKTDYSAISKSELLNGGAPVLTLMMQPPRQMRAILA